MSSLKHLMNVWDSDATDQYPMDSEEDESTSEVAGPIVRR